MGVKFDEPVGISNGSCGGISYFTCPDNYGSFVRGKNITVGDFPVRDLMDSDEEEDAECHCEHNDDDEI